MYRCTSSASCVSSRFSLDSFRIYRVVGLVSYVYVYRALFIGRGVSDSCSMYSPIRETYSLPLTAEAGSCVNTFIIQDSFHR